MSRLGWRELDAQYPGIFSSLWMFPSRGEGGDVKFHGNFIPQVPRRLIDWLTCPGDNVWDPMAGSGTSYDVAKELNRIPIMSDLTPMRPQIWPADARYAVPVSVAPATAIHSVYAVRPGVEAMLEGDTPLEIQLLILHPPYHNIVSFSDNPADLSQCPSVANFLEQMYGIALHLDQYIMRLGYVALVMGNIYIGGQGVIPLAHLTMDIWRARMPNYQVRSIITKNICGNVKGSGDPRKINLNKSRHHRNGTTQFREEKVTILKKLRYRKATD